MLIAIFAVLAVVTAWQVDRTFESTDVLASPPLVQGGVASRYDPVDSPTADVERMKAKRRIDAANQLRRRSEASRAYGNDCIYTANWSNC